MKFEIEITRTVEETARITVEVAKADVVEEYDLTGEDKADWQGYVEDYLHANGGEDWDSLVDMDEVERNTEDWQLNHVEGI